MGAAHYVLCRFSPFRRLRLRSWIHPGGKSQFRERVLERSEQSDDGVGRNTRQGNSVEASPAMEREQQGHGEGVLEGVLAGIPQVLPQCLSEVEARPPYESCESLFWMAIIHQLLRSTLSIFHTTLNDYI